MFNDSLINSGSSLILTIDCSSIANATGSLATIVCSSIANATGSLATIDCSSNDNIAVFSDSSYDLFCYKN